MSPVFCCVPITIKEDALYFSAEVPQRLRGSALSFVTVSDGKPCSGVRGDQQVSTASYSSCAGSGTGCGLFAEALYGFCCFRRFGKEPCLMKKISVKKLALAGMLCALCVVGSVFSFPMFGSNVHLSSTWSM